MIKTTISWPEPMLEEARETAAKAGQSLEILLVLTDSALAARAEWLR